MAARPNLLVVSAVHPFPGAAGQQLRVRNSLLAFRGLFRTTFLTIARYNNALAIGEVKGELQGLVDEVIVLPSLYHRGPVARAWLGGMALGFSAVTGLKRSNFLIGQVELSPRRVLSAVDGRRPDIAVFEYWHAHRAAAALREAGVTCVLDMHNLLWRSYERQLLAVRWIPGRVARRRVAAYQAREQAAWRDFDALITINRAEHEHVRAVLGDDVPLCYAPMGVDLDLWPYSWNPVLPPRVAYYGGLGSPHNRRDAMHCALAVMPLVWQSCPEAELWIVGSNPPTEIRSLPDRDSRIHVTGFVRDVAPLLTTMSAVLCPWTGTYGFRSRLIELMALGVPVVASSEAVQGMDLTAGVGLLLAESASGMAEAVGPLLSDRQTAQLLSRTGRQVVESSFSFSATYGELARALLALVQ